MAKVKAPNQQYSGLSAGIMFVNGVGETDNPHLLTWFEEKGYDVEQLEPEAEQSSLDPASTGDDLLKEPEPEPSPGPEPETEPEANKPAKKGK